ncbi:hypothetical protein TCAL_08157 [Tigriopus californicus]|uniref:U4/U6.U5 tri-snRNP-associated protein 1 n=1 Tax=Tigriopus californicus TaxID=6832 RepID=A0A553P224_TIGCA|nr:hypothetical protein TCAL_08157 [Tigriopus californicus]
MGRGSKRPESETEEGQWEDDDPPPAEGGGRSPLARRPTSGSRSPGSSRPDNEGDVISSDEDFPGPPARSAPRPRPRRSSRKSSDSAEDSEDSADSAHAPGWHRKRVKDKKKRKKSKKDKKKKKKRKHAHGEAPRSHSASGQRRQRSPTDREGGSTPEVAEREEEIETAVPVIATRRRATAADFFQEEEPEPRRDRSRSRPAPRRPSRSRERAHRGSRREERAQPRSREERTREREREREPRELKAASPPPKAPAPEGGSQKILSMSVAESNALRASLGLAPLKEKNAVDPNGTREERREHKAREEFARAQGGTLIPNSTKHEIHKAPENLSQKTHAEKLRERIQERKKKREMEARLLAIKKLGDSDSDEDRRGSSSNWVERQKKIQAEKAAALKRARMLEELEDDFGVGHLVQEAVAQDRAGAYGKKDLSGLKVEHSAENFASGRDVILTLKDSDVLDASAEDTLVNVNIMDDERTKKKLEEVKKAKVGYNAYDQEEVDELTGELKRKNMLDKYDEEIEGEQRTSFKIGHEGDYNEEEQIERQRQKIREKLNAAKRLESLALPELKVASDYYTSEETAQFKKPKKKRKVKKRILRADDLLADLEADSSANKKPSKSPAPMDRSSKGALPMDLDEDVEIKFEADLDDVKLEDEGDMGLEAALNRARKLKQKRENTDVAEQILEEIKAEPKVKQETEEDLTGSELIGTFEEEEDGHQSQFGKPLIMNETVEFCRNLGARQFNDQFERGQKIKQESSVSKDLLEFEESLTSAAGSSGIADRSSTKEPHQRGQWEEVDNNDDDSDFERDMKMDVDSHGEDDMNNAAILEEEPDLQSGVAAAIQLANSKGYWEKEEKKATGSNLKHLMAKNYSIDDKMRMDDERGGRRGDRYGGGGPSQPFQEKANYVPNVQLEYIDDGGRLMNQKEAFRYLSHKFHGKGSGKMKTEKRMKKVMEQSLMMNMSSTDTPLQTVEKLKKKQKESATPYLVLSGNKINPQDLKK